MDSNNNDTEVPEDQLEEQALQLKVKDFAYRSKAKAKPQKREPVDHSLSIIPMNERKWIDIEPGNYSLSLSAYEVSKKGIHLLRHSQKVQREDDGAVQFWRFKEHLQIQYPQIPYWSDDRWKSCLAAGGGAKRRYQYCTDVSGIIIYLRALQNIQDAILLILLYRNNVVIQRGFFHHIYHIGCGYNLHSIINNRLIPGGQNSSKRQTVFFLPIDPRDKEHKDPEHIDLSVPRHAQYLHNAWKKHQDAVYWVDIDLAIRKGLTFSQIRSNAIILQGTLPAYCSPKVVRLKTGEVLYEKAYMSPRPPPKISWSFIGPGCEKKWYSAENSPQGAWDNIAEEKLLEFAESGHPIFSATTPSSRGILKSKGHGKLSIHFAADEHTIETIFRFILSVNQLSICGAVAAICEEFENHQDGSGEPEILMGQSIVLGEIKAEVPLQNENL